MWLRIQRNVLSGPLHLTSDCEGSQWVIKELPCLLFVSLIFSCLPLLRNLCSLLEPGDSGEQPRPLQAAQSLGQVPAVQSSGSQQTCCKQFQEGRLHSQPLGLESSPPIPSPDLISGALGLQQVLESPRPHPSTPVVGLRAIPGTCEGKGAYHWVSCPPRH